MNVITKFRAYRTAVSDTSNFIDFGTNSDGHYLNGRGDNPLILLTNSGEKMRITSTGNVGVGTSTPIAKLSVDYEGIAAGQNVLSLHTRNTGTSDYNMIESGHGTGTNFVLKGYGYVGIGTSSPQFPLHIVGGASPANYFLGSFVNGTSYTTDASGKVGYSYFNNIGYNLTGGGYWNGRDGLGWGLFVNTCILAAELDAYSDKRIKTNIVDIDDAKALSILRQIKPKTYDYVDKVKRGNENVIGFIAQEIKEIIPKAVKMNIDYIPNFMTLCQVSQTDVSNIMLVTSPVDLSWNPLHDICGNAFVDAAGNASSDASGNKVFNVKLYDQSNNEIICKTTDVLDKRSFLMDISGTTLLATNQYFLYGQEIDDFHTLDKQAIFTVVTAAVQDIDRKQQASLTQIQELLTQIQYDEAKIADLESKNATLESKNATLESKNATLESTVSTLQTQLAAQQSLIASQQAQIDAILAKIGGV